MVLAQTELNVESERVEKQQHFVWNPAATSVARPQMTILYLNSQARLLAMIMISGKRGSNKFGGLTPPR